MIQPHALSGPVPDAVCRTALQVDALQRPGALFPAYHRLPAGRARGSRSLVAAGQGPLQEERREGSGQGRRQACEGRRSGGPTQARCRLAARAAGNLSGCRTEGRRIPGARHARAGGAGCDARCGQPAVRGTVGDDPLPPAAGADLCRCRLGQVDHPGPAGGVHALPPGRRAAAADSDFLHQRFLCAVARTIAAAARALAVPVRRGPGAAVRAHFPFGARQPGPRGARQSALVRTTGRPRPRRRAGQPPCRRTPASGPAAPAEAGLPAVLRGKPGVPRQDPQAAGTAAAGGAGRGRAAAAEGAAGAVQAGRRVPGAAAVRSLPCPGRVRREPGPARRTPGQRQAGMRVAREDLRRSHGTVLGEVPGAVARGGPDDLRRRVPAARRADGRRGPGGNGAGAVHPSADRRVPGCLAADRPLATGVAPSPGNPRAPRRA